MRTPRIRSVAVVGGGPAGASLATYLARAGIRVALFAKGKRPPLIVGESLVPAIIPFLRELGVEEEVASYSKLKPGATFVFDLDHCQSFRFDEVPGARVDYSYNVPRDRFDASILEAAVRAGARLIDHRAVIERVGVSDEPVASNEGSAHHGGGESNASSANDGSNAGNGSSTSHGSAATNGSGTNQIPAMSAAAERVTLDAASLEAAREALGGEPDWIVDASGRSRLIANLLDIDSVVGPRRDAALHAHMRGVPVVCEGNVHTDRLERGWCWRIPLPDRISVGLVVNAEYLAGFGSTNEEQFDAYLRHDERIRSWGATAERISPVIRYNNYQLRSTRGVGPNWAMVGDAFGFVDPVFSSGLLIGLDGARALAHALVKGNEPALQRYEHRVQHNLAVWQRLVDYYYDGRLFTLFTVGEEVRKKPIGRIMDFHFRRHMPRVFTGEASKSRYSVGLVDFMVKWGIYGHDPREFQVE